MEINEGESIQLPVVTITLVLKIQKQQIKYSWLKAKDDYLFKIFTQIHPANSKYCRQCAPGQQWLHL